MINGYAEQFLDTGWYSEATLYYNEENLYYHSILQADGTLQWERVLEIHNTDLELIKKQFLESAIYDGKPFWDAEKELAWLDEGTPIDITDN